MDLVGSYRCDCKSGYTGSNCETGYNYIQVIITDGYNFMTSARVDDVT